MGELTPGVELSELSPTNASRWLVSAAWALPVVYVVLGAASLVLEARYRGLDPSDVEQTIAFLCFVVVGAFVAARRPDNPVGWILCGVALAAAVSTAAEQYTVAFLAGADLPAPALAAWLEEWVWAVSIGLGLIVLPLVFPDGRLPSARWRPIAALAVAAIALPTATYAFAPGPLDSAPEITNPLGIGPIHPLADLARAVIVMAVVIAVVVCAIAPIDRYRRAAEEDRQRLKWFAFAGVLLVASFLLNLVLGNAVAPVLALSLALVPIAIGIAILRYRLYQIDVIINQTLVWVPLTAILGGGYAALVAFLQRVFVALTGDRSDGAVIISTLVLAGTFTPVRRTLDTLVDRRFRAQGASRQSEGPKPEFQAAPDPATRPALEEAELDRRMEAIAEAVVLRMTGRRSADDR